METKYFFCVKGASRLEGGKVLLRYSLWRQPLLSVVNDHIVVYPSPSNLNISWNWGSLAGLCLVVQIITGILLAMHYAPHVDLAFSSVQHFFFNRNALCAVYIPLYAGNFWIVLNCNTIGEKISRKYNYFLRDYLWNKKKL